VSNGHPPVRLDVDGAVATLTLDRPEKRNILTVESMQLLTSLLARAVEDASVRLVVLASTGAAFCAGADLATTDGFAGGPQALVPLLEALLDCPKPTVACVQGTVAGGGNGLVAACDIGIALSGAKFAFSEVRVGVAPAVVSVVCLPKMRPADAADLFLTGRVVLAEQARELGLISRVGDDLNELRAQVVDELLRGGPEAMAATKQLLRRVPAFDRDEAFAWACGLSAERFGSDEAASGRAAFAARVDPPWVTGPEPQSPASGTATP
jgi:methylglutaconyl-CoA hydratase